jgi:hypothetical protein
VASAAVVASSPALGGRDGPGPATAVAAPSPAVGEGGCPGPAAEVAGSSPAAERGCPGPAAEVAVCALLGAPALIATVAPVLVSLLQLKSTKRLVDGKQATCTGDELEYLYTLGLF